MDHGLEIGADGRRAITPARLKKEPQCIVAIGANASAHRFADLTAKLIARRVVSHPYWMLDQLSFLVASRYAIDLAEATGLPFDACFISDGDAEEKQINAKGRRVFACGRCSECLIKRSAAGRI